MGSPESFSSENQAAPSADWLISVIRYIRAPKPNMGDPAIRSAMITWRHGAIKASITQGEGPLCRWSTVRVMYQCRRCSTLSNMLQ